MTTDTLASGWVPGHIMAITSPPAHAIDADECLWWPVASCTCGWESDEQSSTDAARDAHAQHLLLAAPMCRRHRDRIAVNVGGSVRMCHDCVRSGVESLVAGLRVARP